jgi:hypothetical protein
VFVVGGRAFTSQVMQKNCTEFIAYENLVSRGRPTPATRGSKPGSSSELAGAMPLVRRALKLLADREVLPQLGLLKSTLLQLDSAFSERDYGASSFRDFVQKLANAGYVTLKGSDRSFHVELREAAEAPVPAPSVPAPPAPAGGASADTAPVEEAAASQTAEPAARGRQADALRLFQQAFAQAKTAPRWPMYARQVKQLVKGADPQFDERTYGFNGIIDALRFGQREGLFRLERDRLGVVRIFPGPALQVRPGGVSEPADQPSAPPEDQVDGATVSVADAQDEVRAASERDLLDQGVVVGAEAESSAATVLPADEEPVRDEGVQAADEVAPPGTDTPAPQGRRRSRAKPGGQPRARKTSAPRRSAAGNAAPRRARGRKPED